MDKSSNKSEAAKGNSTSAHRDFEAPVHVFTKRGEREFHIGTLDTIVFEPDHERVTMTWRVTRPLKKSIFEVAQVRVGIQGRERWHQDTSDAQSNSERASAAA